MSELKTHAEIIEFINELEAKFPVNEWKSEGIHLWPLIRVQLAYTLYGAAHKQNQVTEKPNKLGDSLMHKKSVNAKSIYFQTPVLNRYLTVLKKALTYYRLQKEILKPSQLLFLSFSANRTLLSGKWYNRQIDPLIEQCARERISAALLEFHNGAGYKIPRFYEAQCINAEEILLQYTKKNSFSASLSLQVYQAFVEYVKSKTKKVSVPFLDRENLQVLTNQFITYSQFFKKVLIKKQAKACVLTNYYDIKHMAACVACRQAGIPSIDLQHGAQGNFHVAYGRWNAIPENGYASLPSFFWCWSEQEKQSIDKWAIYSGNEHKAVISGNHWLRLWREQQDPLIQQYDTLLKKIKLPEPEAIHILYSMQPIPDALPACILEAINQSPAHWKWWIRIHPRQEGTAYKNLLTSRCIAEKFNYEDVSSLPLPAILKHTQVHITNWSSVAIEAAEFNIPSVLIHQNGADLHKNLIEKAMAVHASCTAPDIIYSVTQLLNSENNIEEQPDISSVLLRNLLNNQDL